jgi:pimeloyl-ACP methyl ester carboxylesterase
LATETNSSQVVGAGWPATTRQTAVAGLKPSACRADVVAVDASLAYYMDRSVVRRLHFEVVAPARAAGYRRILAVGVSMGGFGSLLLSEIHPSDLDGLVLIAPFLGEGLIAQEMPPGA